MVLKEDFFEKNIQEPVFRYSCTNGNCKSALHIHNIFVFKFVSELYPSSCLQRNMTGSSQMQLPDQLEHTIKPRLILNKFDSTLYLDIAQNGYDSFVFDQKHEAANRVLFPLFPLLISLGKVFLIDLALFATFLSYAFLYGALVFIYHCIAMMNKVRGDIDWKSIILLMLIYPSSIYYFVPYTESLFLMLSAMVIFFSLSKRYKIAFLIAGLSMVTRVPGFLNILLVRGFVLMDKDFKIRVREVSLWVSGKRDLVRRSIACIFKLCILLQGIFSLQFRSIVSIG